MGLPREYSSANVGKQKSKRKIRVGDQYVVHTFASVKVHTEITKIDDEEKGIYTGKLLRQEDVASLREAGVPYKNKEDPASCEGVVYDFQIIKKIQVANKKKKKKRRYVRKNTID